MRLSQGLAALGLTFAALAAHAEITGTVTGVTDYDFRGITQTANNPALQGSLDLSLDSGFYAGLWASNVDFGGFYDENWELDYYAGFRGGEDITYDVGAIYYSYPGTNYNLDYPEIYGGLGWKWFSGKVWYSPDFGSSGDNAWYYEANGSYELPKGFGATAHVGFSDGDYWDNAYGNGYNDWSVGLTYAWSHFNFALKYIDGSDLEDLDNFCKDDPSNEACKDKNVFSTDARVVFSISTTFPWSAE